MTEYFSTAAESVKVTVLSAESIVTEFTVLAKPLALTVNIEVGGNGVESSGESYVKIIVLPAAVFVADTNVGTVRIGVTEFEAADAEDGASPLSAIALNVYAVPLVSPGTAQLPEVPVTVQVAPPGVAVTV
jgi:hypothetical protein